MRNEDKDKDQEQRAREGVRDLLTFVGEDPDREGLLDTPGRVVRAYREMTGGYRMDPREILGRVFREPYDQMILVRDIQFSSLCEHHLLPFSGTADVAYVPNPVDGFVVGLSKIPRLVQCFSRRLQIQERMTTQIADAIQENLNPLGVGVVVRAYHSCCETRGARSRNMMVTSDLKGVFRKPEVRAEFFGLSSAPPRS